MGALARCHAKSPGDCKDGHWTIVWEDGERVPFSPGPGSLHPVVLFLPCAAEGVRGVVGGWSLCRFVRAHPFQRAGQITVFVTGDRSFDISRPQIIE